MWLWFGLRLLDLKGDLTPHVDAGAARVAHVNHDLVLAGVGGRLEVDLTRHHGGVEAW